MKILIRCSGEGKRLQPLTVAQPKALVPIVLRSCLDRILDAFDFEDSNVEITVATNPNHFAQISRQVAKRKQYIEVKGSGYQSCRDILMMLETAGREGLLVISGDNCFDFSLRDVLHTASHAEHSLLVIHEISNSPHATLSIDSSNIIHSYSEKSQRLIGTGCYFLHPNDFNLIHHEIECSDRAQIDSSLISIISSRTTVVGWVTRKAWFDIGSYQGIISAWRHYAPSVQDCSRDQYGNLMIDQVAISGSTPVTNCVFLGKAKLHNCHLSECVIDDGVELANVTASFALIGS